MSQELRWTHTTDSTRIVLQGEPTRHGVVSLCHNNSDVDLVREPYFALNFYRFMDQGRLMAVARDEPFQAEGTADGMTLRWQATADHPAELVADYRISGPDTIDLHVTSKTLAPLKAYEVYLSSYFDFSMDPYIVIPKEWNKSDNSDQLLLKLIDHPLIHSHYLVFPRNSRAAAQRFDGRWINPSTGKLIAPWISGPMLSHPIVIMARENEYVVQMIDPDSWLAIGTTYSGQPDDNIVRHNALYLSLFGDDTEADTVQTARIRQVLCSGTPSIENALALYEQFLVSLK